MTKKYLVRFGEKQIGEPVFAECVLATKVKINILRADADGNVLISVPKEDEKKVLDFFAGKGLKLKEQKNSVRYDRDRCVDCGACIAICPTKAFSYDKSMKLVFDEDKCVLCGQCIDACPRRALSKPEF